MVVLQRFGWLAGCIDMPINGPNPGGDVIGGTGVNTFIALLDTPSDWTAANATDMVVVATDGQSLTTQAQAVSSIPDASRTVKGLAQIAGTDDILTGTEDGAFTTPLAVSEALDLLHYNLSTETRRTPGDTWMFFSPVQLNVSMAGAPVVIAGEDTGQEGTGRLYLSSREDGAANTDADKLFTIHPATGHPAGQQGATTIGATWASIMSMTALGDKLYGVTNTNTLVEIDTATYTEKSVTATFLGAGATAPKVFAHAGVLYAMDEDDETFYTVDVSDGSATEVKKDTQPYWGQDLVGRGVKIIGGLSLNGHVWVLDATNSTWFRLTDDTGAMSIIADAANNVKVSPNVGGGRVFRDVTAYRGQVYGVATNDSGKNPRIVRFTGGQ